MDYGWLRPAWIGVKVQQVTPEMALALGMSHPRGSIVADVAPGGPAAGSGLHVGDVILRVDETVPTDERALLRAIASTPIGKAIDLGLWRDGKDRSLQVTVQEWPRQKWETIDAPVAMAAPHHNVPADFGLSMAALDDANRARFGVAQATSGVLVTGVAAGTDAAQRGLVAGDVILRVQDKAVANAAEARAALDAARKEPRDFILVLVDPKVHKHPGPEWVVLRVSGT